MAETTPQASFMHEAIAASDAPVKREATLSRLVWLFLFVLPTSVIATAAFLVPNAAGHGTHTQLGLPPCGFFVVTGLPCPGCGLTTSFSHMVRFDVVGASMSNPFGVILFLVTLSTAVVALFGFVRGWPVAATLERLHADKWAMLLAVSSLLVWVTKMVTILGGL